jgi:hypothetical protein
MTVENMKRDAKVASLNEHRADSKRAAGGAGLAELSDASHFDNRGLRLPHCKASGLLTFGVDSNKSFAVAIKNFNLPVTVFPPLVFPEYCGFPASFHLRDTITLNSSSTQFRRRATFT